MNFSYWRHFITKDFLRLHPGFNGGLGRVSALWGHGRVATSKCSRSRCLTNRPGRVGSGAGWVSRRWVQVVAALRCHVFFCVLESKIFAGICFCWAGLWWSMPGTRSNHSFMDVWWNNHFPSKDLWNIVGFCTFGRWLTWLTCAYFFKWMAKKQLTRSNKYLVINRRWEKAVYSVYTYIVYPLNESNSSIDMPVNNTSDSPQHKFAL